jgi:hypothetical protein
MKTLRFILKAIGMAAHAVPTASRFGKILLLLGGLLTADVTAAPPPTDWHWVLPSQVMPDIGGFGSDVAHGNGTFVAVGGYGVAATSRDGLNWKPVLPGTFDYFASVAFGDGIFVAGGSGSISISTDGSHWEQHPGVGDRIELLEIRHLGNLFVATGMEYLTDGRTGGVLYTSTNGRQWVRRLRLQPPDWHDVYLTGIAYGNGRFVVVGGQHNFNPGMSEAFTYTSTDGLTWTRAGASPTPLSSPGDIAFGEAGFVLLDSGRILTSADGVSWQIRYVSPILDESKGTWFFWHGIAIVGNRIVCTGIQTGVQTPQELAVTSGDGVSWQETPLPRKLGDPPRTVFSDGANFFAIAERSALSSPDGIAWTEHFTPHPLDSRKAGLTDVVYGPEGFVAVGDKGTILSSRDGVSWEPRTSGTGRNLRNVSHGGGRYVAVGNGSLVHSADGQNWTSVDLEIETLPIGPLAHGAGRFVLFTQTGSAGFWTSADGMTWQLRFSDALKFHYGIFSVAYGNGRFVVTGYHFESNGGHYRAEVAVSADGITWQRIVLPEPYSTLFDPNVIHDGTRFLAWGGRFSQLLLASPDGLVWTTLEETPGYLNSVGHGDGNIVAVRAINENNSWTYPPIGLLDSSVDGSSWTTVAPFQFQDYFSYPLKFAYGAGRFVGVGRNWDNSTWGGTARLLISGFTPPLALPQLDLRREAARLMLRIRGTSGSHWTLQRSSTLLDWQTVGPITLGTEPLEIDVTPTTESQGFWRLAAPNQ